MWVFVDTSALLLRPVQDEKDALASANDALQKELLDRPPQEINDALHKELLVGLFCSLVDEFVVFFYAALHTKW